MSEAKCNEESWKYFVYFYISELFLRIVFIFLGRLDNQLFHSNFQMIRFITLMLLGEGEVY